MRHLIRPAVAALAIVGLAASITALSGGSAFSQAKQAPAPAQAAPPAEAPMKQVFEVRVGPIRTEHKCDDAAKVATVAAQWTPLDKPGRKEISL